MDLPPESEPARPTNHNILLRYQASDREYAIFREIKVPMYASIGELVKQLGVDSLTRWDDARGQRAKKPMTGTILMGGIYDITAAGRTNCFEDMVKILTEFNYTPKKSTYVGKAPRG